MPTTTGHPHRNQAGLTPLRRRMKKSLELPDLNLSTLTPFEYLRPRSLPNAELHSVEHVPPPRCHPTTRVEFRGEINARLTDESQEQDMLWLFGPASVGKSAIAQTVGELAEEPGIFGAPTSFSRSRKADNPSFFTTSIADQLVRRNAAYGELVIDAIRRILMTWRSVDERTQFRKLLAEPFHTLKLRGKLPSKLLIVIDGLDECWGETEQLSLVRLIADAVEDLDSPLLWLICSRPEHHLKRFFLIAAFPTSAWNGTSCPRSPVLMLMLKHTLSMD